MQRMTASLGEGRVRPGQLLIICTPMGDGLFEPIFFRQSINYADVNVSWPVNFHFHFSISCLAPPCDEKQTKNVTHLHNFIFEFEATHQIAFNK